MGQEPLPLVSDWTAQGTGLSNTASAPNEPVRSGVGSLQTIANGGFGVPLMVHTFPASPGQRWDLQGYMLTKDPVPANATFGLFKIVFDDGAMDLQPAQVLAGEADSPDFPGVVALPRLNNAAAANTWQFAHAAGIAPEGTVQVRLFTLVVDESPATIYFDDVQALLGGDFDTDLDIDGADLPVWKGAFGPSAVGDADGDGDSDGNDFIIWQRSFSGASGATVQAGAVPEPCSSLLAAGGLVFAAGARRKRFF
jgi:hypothetical protein